MPPLREAHKCAANPEPFQPYAAYLAWVRECDEGKRLLEKYENAIRSNNRQPIEVLSQQINKEEASESGMLGFISGYARFSLVDGTTPISNQQKSALRDLVTTILPRLKESTNPRILRDLACLIQIEFPEIGIWPDPKIWPQLRKRAAEGGDLRAQYELGRSKIGTEESEESNLDGLKWLWTAAKGLYPPALMWWKDTLLSHNTIFPGSFLNVEQEQIDEMAESFDLLSRLVKCTPNDQQKYLKGVRIGRMAAWEVNGMILYSDSVLAALTKWEQEQEQESPYAIENLMKSLYGLARLDRDAPIMKSPTATPPNAPNATPA